MITPRVLFIPDRLSDYRMWSDLPDRLADHAQVVHYDQHEPVPWTGRAEELVVAASRLAGDGGFAVVVADGEAARFAIPLARAGLARGLVLFSPSFDRLPDDVHLDFSGLDLRTFLDPYQPVGDDPDPDPGVWRGCLRLARAGQPARCRRTGPGVAPARPRYRHVRRSRRGSVRRPPRLG